MMKRPLASKRPIGPFSQLINLSQGEAPSSSNLRRDQFETAYDNLRASTVDAMRLLEQFEPLADDINSLFLEEKQPILDAVEAGDTSRAVNLIQRRISQRVGDMLEERLEETGETEAQTTEEVRAEIDEEELGIAFSPRIKITISITEFALAYSIWVDEPKVGIQETGLITGEIEEEKVNDIVRRVKEDPGKSEFQEWIEGEASVLEV